MENQNLSNPASSRRKQGATAVNRRRRRHRPKITLWIGLAASLVLGSIAWLGIKAMTIKTELSAATELVPTLKKDVLRNDPASAASTVGKLQAHTKAAREAGTDPFWTAAGALPWLGPSFQAASQAATSADDIARLGAAPLVGIFQSFDWKSLTPNGGGITLAPLTAAEPRLASAAQAIQLSSDRLNGIDVNDLVPQVAAPLIRAREELNSLRGGLSTAADAAKIAPAMLGRDGPRRYLLLVENNAEARATGGIPGALAILAVNNGKISLDSQTSAADLGAFSPPVPLDPEQERIYTGRLGTYMQDVNLSPDFPSAAAAAMSMWERKTGERVAGVISIDPVALGYILDATGPVELTDQALMNVAGQSLPTELTGRNVLQTLLSDVYAKIAKPQLQDVYFAGVAKAVFAAVSSGNGDDRALLDEVAKAAAERRVLLWSAAGQEQAILNKYPVSGAISGPSVAPAQFGVYFNDGTGAKMDYYVKRTAQLVKECPADGYQQARVRITSTNTAPADAATSLPAYVTGGGDFGVPAGTVRTNVIAYGPAQADVETATVDGKKTGFATQEHANRPVGSVTVTLAPGQSSTVEFSFGRIVQHTEPTVVVTPTVQTVKEVVLATENAGCETSK